MEYRRFGDTYVVRLQRGEEILTKLMELCRSENIRLAHIEGLGAAGKVTVGCYNVEEKHYYKSQYEGGTFEITSLTGNVSEMNGEPYLHVHMSFAGEDGIGHGGHLNEAVIAATAEIFVRCIDGHV
ncbi:MAG: DNA-binding protein, partial [Firmicutes bacterium]|nr:DNA-binding protein [Bacillota bacterium]